MNSKTLFFSFLLIFTACKDSNNPSEHIPKFEGITIRETPNAIPIQTDPGDWQLDTRFSQIERKLFDTIKIENHWLKSSNTYCGDVIAEPRLNPIFYPNPVRNNGYFSYYSPATIANIVIVDKFFNKKIELRTEFQMLGFDFSSFKKGIYRMYYVFQDSDYNVTGLGFGDIMIGDLEYDY